MGKKSRGCRYMVDILMEPPKDKGDLAFVQHMKSLNSDGKMGVVVPHGACL